MNRRRINDNGPPPTYSLRNEILRIIQHAQKILDELDARKRDDRQKQTPGKLTRP